jgi:murein DD-endopeptidase MepM/ murein hydrolase activator NlpD
MVAPTRVLPSAAVRPTPPNAPSLAAALSALLLASGAAGCSHAPPPKMSFAEAGLAAAPEALPEAPPDEAPLPPPVAVPAPETVALEAPAGPPVDAILVRFTTEARGRRGRLPAARAFPEEAAAAWRALASELDGYLARPLPQTPLLELVRARITLEAEWDYDARRFGDPPRDLEDEVRARVARLARRVETARALGFALFAQPAPARLRWPVEQAGLSSLFGMRLHPVDGRRRLHQGIDLAAGAGKIVSAAAAGWVVRTGWAGGYGLLVEVRHPGDLTTRYSHLSALLCAAGDAVDAGQPLGLVGRTGLATGPHLHFEVWKAGEPLDPLPLLGAATAASGAPEGAGGP